MVQVVLVFIFLCLIGCSDEVQKVPGQNTALLREQESKVMPLKPFGHIVSISPPQVKVEEGNSLLSFELQDGEKKHKFLEKVHYLQPQIEDFNDLRDAGLFAGPNFYSGVEFERIKMLDFENYVAPEIFAQFQVQIEFLNLPIKARIENVQLGLFILLADGSFEMHKVWLNEVMEQKVEFARSHEAIAFARQKLSFRIPVSSPSFEFLMVQPYFHFSLGILEFDVSNSDQPKSTLKNLNISQTMPDLEMTIKANNLFFDKPSHYRNPPEDSGEYKIPDVRENQWLEIFLTAETSKIVIGEPQVLVFNSEASNCRRDVQGHLPGCKREIGLCGAWVKQFQGIQKSPLLWDQFSFSKNFEFFLGNTKIPFSEITNRWKYREYSKGDQLKIILQVPKEVQGANNLVIRPINAPKWEEEVYGMTDFEKCDHRFKMDYFGFLNFDPKPQQIRAIVGPKLQGQIWQYNLL